MNTSPLGTLLVSHRSGYWGSEQGNNDSDVRVIRNGDIGTNGNIRWNQLPIRSLSFNEVSKSEVEEGDILLTTSGDCGYVAFLEAVPRETTCATNFVRILRADRGLVVPKYLFHWMNRSAFRASLRPFIRGTAMKNLSVSTALNESIVPLPPLPEQRRIAAILDQADELRTKRLAASDHLDTLKKSIFLEMFASDVSETWDLTTIEVVTATSRGSLRTGPFGSQLLHSEFVDSGVAVLGIDNAVENEFRWSKLRYISPDKYKVLARYTVHPGDVLITIMGTCGRCAIVPDDIPLAINTKHLCCITLDQTLCQPMFLHSYFLYHPLARQYLQQTAKGAVMDGLNMGIIRQLPLRLPPLFLQEEYGRRISALQSVEVTDRQSASALDDLFASLQHRAFRGEL